MSAYFPDTVALPFTKDIRTRTPPLGGVSSAPVTRMPRTSRSVIGVAVVVLVLGCSDTRIAEISGPSIQRCQTALSGLAASVAPSGARLDATVSTARECQWTAASEAPWMQVAPSAGQGEAALTVVVAENATAIARSAAIVLNESRVMVAQQAAVCRFQLAAQSARIAAEGGRLRVEVSTLVGCGWIASTDVSWIKVGGSQATGSGTVELMVEENTGPERMGTATLAGLPFRLEQAEARSPAPTPAPPSPSPSPTPPPAPAPPSPTPPPLPSPTPAPPAPPPTSPPACAFAIDPERGVIDADGSNGSVRVITDSRCEWTATTSANWLTLAATRGTGEALIRYTVDRNTGPARAGTITIANQTYRVEQEGGASSRLIFTGQVLNLSGTCAEFRFSARGRQIITNGETHFSGGPCRHLQNGIEVEVEGDVQVNGVVLAVRINLKPH